MSSEIREAREALDLRRDELKIQHETAMLQLRMEYKMLALRCKHPDKFRHSLYDGSSYMWCPDCESEL